MATVPSPSDLLTAALARVASVAAAGVPLSAQSQLVLDVANSVAANLETQLQDGVKAAGSAIMSSLDSLMAGSASGIGGDMAEAVPFVGSLVKVAVDMVSAQNAYLSAQREAVQANCATYTQAAPALGLGATVKPCDLFQCASDFSPGQAGLHDPNFWGATSTLGQVLISVFETNYAANSASIPAQYEGYYAVYCPWNSSAGCGAGPGGAAYTPHQRLKVIGQYNADNQVQDFIDNQVLSDLNTTIRDVRIAIAARKGVVGSDGGISLWPIYLDLLTAAWTKYRYSQAFAAYVMNTGVDSVAPYPIVSACCSYNAGVVSMTNMLTSWRNTVSPKYEPEISNQRTMIARARTALLHKGLSSKLLAHGLTFSNLTPAKAKAAVKAQSLSKSLTLAPRAATVPHPAASVALGVGAVGVVAAVAWKLGLLKGIV